MATHSSVLAWRIPGMGEPGGLPSMGSHRVRHNWSNLAAVAAAEENRGENLHNTGLGSDFLATTSKEWSIEAKSDKWEYIKTKSFFTAKDSINKMKKKYKEYEKYL